MQKLKNLWALLFVALLGALATPVQAAIDETSLTALKTSLSADMTSVMEVALVGVTAAIGVGLTVFGIKFIAGLMLSTFQKFGRKG